MEAQYTTGFLLLNTGNRGNIPRVGAPESVDMVLISVAADVAYLSTHWRLVICFSRVP